MAEPARPPISDAQRQTIAMGNIAKDAVGLVPELLSRRRLESYYLRNDPQKPAIIVELGTSQDPSSKTVKFDVQSPGQLLPGARPLEKQQFKAVTLLQSILASGNYNRGMTNRPEVCFSYPSTEQGRALQFETDMETTYRIFHETAGNLGLGKADLEVLLTKFLKANPGPNIANELLQRLRTASGLVLDDQIVERAKGLSEINKKLLDDVDTGRERIRAVAGSVEKEMRNQRTKAVDLEFQHSTDQETIRHFREGSQRLAKERDDLKVDVASQAEEITELKRANTELRDALETQTNELEQTRDLMEKAQGERNKANQQNTALKSERDRYKGESDANKKTAEANQRTAEANLRTLKTLNDALGREKKHAKEIKDVDSEALKQANARIKQLEDEVKRLKDKYEPPPPQPEPPPRRGIKDLFRR